MPTVEARASSFITTTALAGARLSFPKSYSRGSDDACGVAILTDSPQVEGGFGECQRLPRGSESTARHTWVVLVIDMAFPNDSRSLPSRLHRA
jgi:hypothetical protein